MQQRPFRPRQYEVRLADDHELLLSPALHGLHDNAANVTVERLIIELAVD
jgi:hypothetical protein